MSQSEDFSKTVSLWHLWGLSPLFFSKLTLVHAHFCLPEFGSFWFHFKQFSHRGTGHICRKFFCNRNERIMCLIPFFLFWFTLLFTVIPLLSKGSPPYQSVAASWGSTPARPSPATSHCPCRWRQQATRKCPPWPLELQCPLLSPRPPRIS